MNSFAGISWLIVFGFHTFLPSVIRQQMFKNCEHDETRKGLPQYVFSRLIKLYCIWINLTVKNKYPKHKRPNGLW